jgi:hypothetical protein
MERVWAARLRWRLRGAWLAPLLVVLTLVDGVLVHALPLAGDRTGLVGGLLLGAFLNFVAVVVVAPVGAMALRRVRGDLPRVVARDYAGAALVVLVSGALLGAGLAHHATVMRHRAALAEALARGAAWIGVHAPPEFRRHAALADAVAIVEGSVYRVCAPGSRPTRAWCAIVRSTVPFPAGVRFAGGEPNALFQAGRE